MNYAAAIAQLQNDLLKKTDGCATSGTPGQNDWVDICTDQAEFYALVQDLIALVKAAE